MENVENNKNKVDDSEKEKIEKLKKRYEKSFNTYEKYKSSHELILIPKIEDFCYYTFQILIKIPRVDKFNIGNELKTACLEMLKWAYFVNNDRRNTLSYLNRIDALKSYSKSLIRILYKNKSIPDNNYKTGILKLDEIGKIIGGLIKSNRNATTRKK